MAEPGVYIYLVNGVDDKGSVMQKGTVLLIR